MRTEGKEELKMAESTHQAAEDEKSGEDPSKDCFGVHITVADRWHGNDQEVNTRPVWEGLLVGKLQPRVTWILDLEVKEWWFGSKREY